MNINNIDRTPPNRTNKQTKTFTFGSKNGTKRVQKITSIISAWFCFTNTPTVYLKTNFVFRFLNYFIIFVITISFLLSWKEFLHFYFRNSIMGHILSKFIRTFRLQFFSIHFLNFLFCPTKLHGQKVLFILWKTIKNDK